MSEQITLELSLDEINLIFQALGERPFKEVFELMGKINEEVNRQMSANNSDDSADMLEDFSNNSKNE